MHLFDYSGISVSIPLDIAETMVRIERLRAFDSIRFDAYRDELRVAMPSAVAGNVSALCPGALPGRPSESDGSGSDEEVCARGCASLLRDISDGAPSPVFDLDLLRDAHRALTEGTAQMPGTFRSRGSDAVTEDLPVRPVPPPEVGPSLEQLAASYLAASDVGLPPILLSPCLFVDLMNIQPFISRNLQVCAVLLDRMLVGCGYGALRAVPLLPSIVQDLPETLEESSSGWNGNSSDPFPFIRLVAGSVLGCYAEFDRRYPLAKGRRVGKAERIRRMISETDVPVTKTDVCRMLPDISRRTADKVLGDLVRAGTIRKTGSYRDARYLAPEEREGGRGPL